MDKKGFTLIELLTVIAILSILFVIVSPQISAAFKESRADQLQEVREMVAKATEVYLDNTCGEKTFDTLKETEEVRISLNVISDCGLIKDKIYNPVSGDYFNIDNEYIVVKINEIGLLEYNTSF